VTGNSPFRLGVLGSGKGSNFVAIAEAIAAGTVPAQIAIVLSDVAEAGILAHARERTLPAQFIAPGRFPTKLDEEAERAYVNALREAQVDLVVLAGFMRVLGAGFVDRYLGRMLNIHPSLLPRHRGLHTHRRALEAGDRVHGASVHFVTAELDGGPVILQARVPVLEGDDEAALAARVLAQEHRIYPECIGWFAQGRLEFRAGAAVLDGQVLATPVLREARDELAA